MLTQTQLKTIFIENNFRPLKRFGENYLIDANIKDKIVAEAHLMEDDCILEIGPGLGALTIDLAKSGADIFAVEKDKKAFAILGEIIGDRFHNLKLFNEDILKFDLDKLPQDKKIRAIGNLPYYITSPIIELLIENRGRVEFFLGMVQREVANRLLAAPGSKDYSSISVFVQYFTRPFYIHTVRRTSFFPQPEVDSSIIRLDMLEKPSVDVKDEKLFFKIVRGAFNQRRKSIINSLCREEVLDLPKGDMVKILGSIGTDPAARPESLSLSVFASIANAV